MFIHNWDTLKLLWTNQMIDWKLDSFVVYLNCPFDQSDGN